MLKSDNDAVTVQESERLPMNGLEDLIGTHIRYAYVMLRRGFTDYFAPLELTQTQCAAMWILAENPGTSSTELANAVGVDRITMMGVIDKLLKKKLVVRTRSQIDRRRQNLSLSNKGNILFEEAKERLNSFDNRYARCLSPGERMILIEILKKITTSSSVRK